MTIPAVLLVALLPLGLAACGREPPPPPWGGTGTEVRVRVHEMHCSGCELSVEKGLGAVPGVAQVRADHESGQVEIRLAPDADRATAIAALREAIHDQGRYVVGEDEIPAGE